MDAMEDRPLTSREASRRTVRRLTKALAALAVAATAAFAAAAASATKHESSSVDDSSASVVVENDSWAGDDYGASALNPPSFAPSSAGQAPSAVSGGS
jgi:hypothetical protein